VNTYKDNDDIKPSELVAAIDARFTKVGRYKTRRGLDRYSVPIGEAVNVQNIATTGAGVATVSGTQAVAQALTVGTAGRLSRVDVNIRSTSTSKGTVLVEVRQSNAGAVGSLIARSSIRAADITSSFTYLPVYFVAAPLMTASQAVFVVIKTQSQTAGAYEVSTTTAVTTGKTSTDAGYSWSSAAFGINTKLYTATDGGVKGHIRVYRPNGQKVTVFAAFDSVYSVDDTTGATTVIKSGMNAAATFYRFIMVQDAIYWVNGLEKPYKWDFTMVTQITACPIIPDDLMEHKGIVIYKDSVDKTKYVYTNFALYDTFTSTDFGYVPGPKSAESLTAFAKLNGVFFFFSRNNKFQLMGSDNATFTLDEAADQRGTFTQESVVFDANFIFHADDNGVHKFNGSESRNLAEPFLEDYLAIPDKSSIQLDIFKNRLYIFYAPAGSADITECFVYNLLLDKLESVDKGTYIGRTFGRDTQDDLFIQGSNRVAALYKAELPTNDFHNLGDQLQFELRTSYSPFDAPSAVKRGPKWRPVFNSATGDYSVQCGYAIDFRTDVTWFDLPLSGSGPRFNTGVKFDTGVKFGGIGLIEPTSPFISGTFKRLQRRYQHVAAREPVEFSSEVLTVQTQRLI
jgi:hypothetical protein